MNVEKVIDFLGDKNTIAYAALLYGLSNQPQQKILKRPLISLFDGAIQGAVYAWGANFVSGLLPEKARGIIPVAIAMHIIYVNLVEEDESEKDREDSKNNFINISYNHKTTIVEQKKIDK